MPPSENIHSGEAAGLLGRVRWPLTASWDASVGPDNLAVGATDAQGHRRILMQLSKVPLLQKRGARSSDKFFGFSIQTDEVGAQVI